MKIYGVKYDCNAPSPKKISIPLNSQFKVNFQIERNGQMIDFTAPGAPTLSVSYNGNALSSDRFLNKGPVFQIDTGNVATRQSIKAALPGSEFNLFVELTDGDVYEIDEVGGGGGVDPSELSDYYTKSETSSASEIDTAFDGYYTKSETSSAAELSDAFNSFEPSVPRDLSVDSITFPHNVINEEEVEANRFAVMLDGEMVIDGNIEANDARLDSLNVFSNLSAGLLEVKDGPGGLGATTNINNATVEVGLDENGTATGMVNANWISLGTSEQPGGFNMTGEFDMTGDGFTIAPSETDGQFGTVQFSIDPGDNGEGNSVIIRGQPQVLIGHGGYIDLSEGVPITVYDSVNDTTVDLAPTHVTIDGVDYVIMAATAPQP